MDIIALAFSILNPSVRNTSITLLVDKGDYYSATLNEGLGRFHALIVSLNNNDVLLKKLAPRLKLTETDTEVTYIDLH